MRGRILVNSSHTSSIYIDWDKNSQNSPDSTIAIAYEWSVDELDLMPSEEHNKNNNKNILTMMMCG